MPRHDIYYDTVKTTLVKDEWTITHDPLVLPFGQRKVYVDIGAEAPFGAEKNDRQIAVEVKSFVGQSEMADLERALGQYVFYRFLLARTDPQRVLYLSIPDETYASIFVELEGQELVETQNLKLIVFDPEQEVIVRWTE